MSAPLPTPALIIIGGVLFLAMATLEWATRGRRR